jgi:hypothetical protein
MHVSRIWKKRKYELDARNSVENESKNLEDVWLNSVNKESWPQGDFRN